LKIKFFSIYTDYIDKMIDIDIDEKPITVRELIDLLCSKYPALKKVLSEIKPLILVDGKSVDLDHELFNNNEVAFIPPSSGG